MRLKSENQDYYLGHVENCYLGYSNDETVRSVAASGGIVSTLLKNLLMSGEIDGALVCRQIMKDDDIDFEVKIVTEPEEIMNFSGSVYFDIPLLSAIDQVRAFEGRIAIVGLPCQLRAVTKFCKKDVDLSKKIKYKIGLFCGHNSRRELLMEVLRKKNVEISDVDSIIFRRGHWRGKMHIHLKNGEEMSFPFQHFSIYQNLHFLSLKKCIYCSDHTAEFSDISCGDAWLPYLKKDLIKHSVIVVRDNKSDNILKYLRREGILYLMKIEPEIVFRSQKRSLIYHKGIEARSTVGKLLGYDIPCPDKYKNSSRWNDYIAAMIVLLNIKLSYNSYFKRLLFAVPKVFLYPYLAVYKILTNF